MQETSETQGQSLGPEDEEGMATYSSILVWRILWAEEPGGLQVHRVAKSRTQLKQLSTHAPHISKIKLPWETLGIRNMYELR